MLLLFVVITFQEANDPSESQSSSASSNTEEGISISSSSTDCYQNNRKRKYQHDATQNAFIAQAIKLIKEWQSEDRQPIDDFTRFGLCVADQLRDLAKHADLLLVARAKFKIDEILYQSSRRACKSKKR